MSTTFPTDITVERLLEFWGTINAICLQEIGRVGSHTGGDPVFEIMELMAFEGQTGEQLTAWLHDQPEAVAYREKPPIPPIIHNPRVWKGAFCIPDALPGQPAGFGDQRRIWTPAYGAYPDTWRPAILAAYLRRGYTHFVYNIASPDGVYHNDYPALPDDPARARRDLLEIRTAGLVPVVAACNDANGGSVTPYASFVANADLIPVCFPMWEMNGPLGVDVMQGGQSMGRLGDCIRHTRAAAPDADLYVHFTAGHGAGAEPEGTWWQWFATLRGVGLLSQDDGYNRQPDGDPLGTAAGLTDTARHFRGEVAGWEGLQLLNVAFEQITTPLYHSGWTEAQQLAYGRRLLAAVSGPNIAGFCDGGPA